MSKFSKRVFAIYFLSFIIIWSLSKTVWIVILFGMIFLQTINAVLKNFLDKYTQYNGAKLFNESEQLRLVYTYFGFPVVLFFPNYFRKLRKDSYYERTLKETDDMIKMYTEHNFPIDQKIRELRTTCDRYLKLKRIKTKQDRFVHKQ